MSDPKPELNTTEMRQANSRRTNLRVLIVGIVVVAIGFALAMWYNATTRPETETTIGAGETLEDLPPPDGGPEVTIEDAPTPAPIEPAPVTPAPVEPAPAQ